MSDLLSLVRRMLPRNHLGREQDAAACGATCGPDEGDGNHEHRTDLYGDRCDMHPDYDTERVCLRCEALVALAKEAARKDGRDVPVGTNATDALRAALDPKETKLRDRPEYAALKREHPHALICLSGDTNGGVCDCGALAARRAAAKKETEHGAQ